MLIKTTSLPLATIHLYKSPPKKPPVYTHTQALHLIAQPRQKRKKTQYRPNLLSSSYLLSSRIRSCLCFPSKYRFYSYLYLVNQYLTVFIFAPVTHTKTIENLSRAGEHSSAYNALSLKSNCARTRCLHGVPKRGLERVKRSLGEGRGEMR